MCNHTCMNCGHEWYDDSNVEADCCPECESEDLEYDYEDSHDED